MQKTVITYGTFDLFHIGHLRLLQRLAAMGDRLIVGVSTDEFNASKGKKCIIPFQQRLEIVGNLRQVDLAIAEHSWEQKLADIQTHGVTTFGIGDDWKGKFDHMAPYCEVVYLERTEAISSTHIKSVLAEFGQNKIQRLKEALEVLQIVALDFQ